MQEVPSPAPGAIVAPFAAPPKQELLYPEIERISKSFKCHRCVLDFDLGFVNSVLNEEVMLEDHHGEAI